jgi:asparagine synthase (glutamine-hydrolysing)
MCGFVSIVNLQGGPAPAETLDRMLSTLVHRGPDDAGVMVDGAVAFGFRRLSIQDLSPLGHQPMSTDDGACTIVFNGEIYNFVELREELRALGHRFRSSGDTEVLLAAYRQWGPDCVSRLNGMWAFIILDRRRRLLFGSRDRFGMKPLYRWTDGHQHLFASEIKAIRASGRVRDALNLRACAEFLHESRLDETSQTFFEGITQLPAGHCFELSLDGGLREWAFWAIEQTPPAAPVDDVPERFAELFEASMRIHLRSDVPVGVNLSGGLDSTSILCAASRLHHAAGASDRLLAFCYFDAAHDESAYVQATIAQTGARLVPLQMTPLQLWDSLPEVLRFQDEPVHSMAPVVSFHLMRVAREHGVEVVLNGQGADEVLGGYPSYFHDRWCDLVRGGHALRAWREIADYAAAHGGTVGPRLRDALVHVVKSRVHQFDLARGPRMRAQRAAVQARDWLSPELAQHLPDDRPPPRPSLRPALQRSVRHDPLPLYLRIEDRNAMAHSVEARLPFLDHRLAEFVAPLDDGWKVRGRWNKFVLREAMRGRIPESVRSRVDKMGFPTSSSSWLRTTLYERAREVVHSRELRELGMFNVAALQNRLERHRQGQGDHSEVLLTSMQMCLWREATRGAAGSGAMPRPLSDLQRSGDAVLAPGAAAAYPQDRA